MDKKIKYIILDVDGTLTDGKIYIGSQGEVFKAFNCKDGYAIHNMLPELGIEAVIITGRQSAIVENRCKELNIRFCYQNIKDKRSKIIALSEQWGLKANEKGIFEEIAYMGDDLNDLEGMRICGLSACPQDAVDDIKSMVDYISEKPAGEGAVRDFIEWYKTKERN